MSFNQFSSRSQNYGKPKGSRRDEIIKQSRAKRQERQKKKKHEIAAQIIQKWYRMNLSNNECFQECKQQFNDKITCTFQSESSLNFVNFDHLLHLFRICLFGFHQNVNAWKIDKKYLSKSSKYENDHKWFTMNTRRLYTIFIRISKNSTKSRHFISQILDDDDKKYKSQMQRFQFFSIILIQYLSLMCSKNSICIGLAIFVHIQL